MCLNVACTLSKKSIFWIKRSSFLLSLISVSAIMWIMSFIVYSGCKEALFLPKTMRRNRNGWIRSTSGPNESVYAHAHHVRKNRNLYIVFRIFSIEWILETSWLYSEFSYKITEEKKVELFPSLILHKNITLLPIRPIKWTASVSNLSSVRKHFLENPFALRTLHRNPL